uniref:OBP22 n=1 Tax=Holotrichia parallela TaxID=93412 RepID=A0A0G2YDB7_HOLPA|nr:OBP22 [Holotrichia parallela]
MHCLDRIYSLALMLLKLFKMKQIIVFLSFIVIIIVEGFIDNQAEEIKEVSRACINSTNVDPALVKRVKDGDIVDDPKVKEFVACVLQKMNLQNADGTFNVELIKSKLPSGLSESERNNIMQKCVTKVGTSAADTAWLAYKCYRDDSRLNFSENL